MSPYRTPCGKAGESPQPHPFMPDRFPTSEAVQDFVVRVARVSTGGGCVGIDLSRDVYDALVAEVGTRVVFGHRLMDGAEYITMHTPCGMMRVHRAP